MDVISVVRVSGISRGSMKRTLATALSLSIAIIVLSPSSIASQGGAVLGFSGPYAHASQTAVLTNGTNGCNRTVLVTPAFNHAATIHGAMSGLDEAQSCAGANDSLSALGAEYTVTFPINFSYSLFAHIQTHLVFQASLRWNVTVGSCTPRRASLSSTCTDEAGVALQGVSKIIDKTNNRSTQGPAAYNFLGYEREDSCSKSNCSVILSNNGSTQGSETNSTVFQGLVLTQSINVSHIYVFQVTLSVTGIAAAGGFGVVNAPGSRAFVSFFVDWSVPDITYF